MKYVFNPLLKYNLQKECSCVNRYTNVGRILASDGVTKKQIDHQQYGVSPEEEFDGDRHQFFFICDGTETILEIGTTLNVSNGIWDIYLNGVLDSSGYDDYNGLDAHIDRSIILTESVIIGLNIIEVRINGKNPLSSSFWFECQGASLQ